MGTRPAIRPATRPNYAPAARVAPALLRLAKPAPVAPAPSAPAGAGLESLDSLDETSGPSQSAIKPAQSAITPAPDAAVGAGGDTEVSLDVGSEDAFTPYTFSRNATWAFLPLGALILLGLHLFRVPKRKSKRKIDQARRFFRGISGEGTNSAIHIPPQMQKGDKK
jgi:hypothetical protein